MVRVTVAASSANDVRGSCTATTLSPRACSTRVIDDQLVQKALARLRGSDSQRDMLASLGKMLVQQPRALALVERMRRDLEEFGAFQNSR